MFSISANYKHFINLIMKQKFQHYIHQIFIKKRAGFFLERKIFYVGQKQCHFPVFCIFCVFISKCHQNSPNHRKKSKYILVYYYYYYYCSFYY